MRLRLPDLDRLIPSLRQGKVATSDAASPGSGDRAPPDDLLHVAGFAVDPATGRVRARDGTVTTLRRQSMLVLQALAQRRGRVVSKEDLFREVWPGIAVTDDSLVQCVGDIRRAIRDEGHHILQTVPKRGYRLLSEVEAAAAPGAPPSRHPKHRRLRTQSGPLDPRAISAPTTSSTEPFRRKRTTCGSRCA
ncbi:winged helix-turn-helix domain-containing protein [Cereibacter sphaeroides]|uniref:winged helix-turn-helix domain-containing protein n=1 Tax=Cereibacter sphaeroides TaxID=1063 RepID=UPI001F345786|nr:winged helix-turn-helix domain-containing protein [Cereibacter sphaeroides]MCE6949923.1 winged helix-turn-helix domain-containing protein [Cereibacter sphaeroides]